VEDLARETRELMLKELLKLTEKTRAAAAIEQKTISAADGGSDGIVKASSADIGRRQ
jgi:hypothetical protein